MCLPAVVADVYESEVAVDSVKTVDVSTVVSSDVSANRNNSSCLSVPCRPMCLIVDYITVAFLGRFLQRDAATFAR